MTTDDINRALTDADQPPYEEVVGEAPEMERVELSARVIHEAFENLKAQLEKLLVADVANVDDMDWEGAEANKQTYITKRRAEYAVKIAQAEVDRVRTLIEFFSVDSILRAADIVGPEA